MEVKNEAKILYRKINRRKRFKGSELVINVKKYEKTGKKSKRYKYTVNLNVELGTSLLVTAKHDDWELPRALHRASDNLKKELEKKERGYGKDRRR